MHESTIKKMEEQEERAFPTAHHDIADYRDTWRVFRIMAELVEGYQFLSSFKNEVTILGSARIPKDHEYSKLAYDLAYKLAKDGFTIITGGGPGLMEAANHGAYDAGGESIGLNIQLPFEQQTNPYVKKSIGFYYFFTRKVMLTSPADAFVYFPGGYGTLDEFFEVVDLMELGLMKRVPIVLISHAFWDPVIDFLKTSCTRIKSVPIKDIESWVVADTAEEAFEELKKMKKEDNHGDASHNMIQAEGKIDWKIFRVMSELVEGFEFLTGIKNAITILGTKSIVGGDAYYDEVRSLGQSLAERGYAVVTGGKTGIAEAANKGAFEVGGLSIGIGMKIASSIELNSYLTKSILFKFPFTRKLMITAPTQAFVFFPGGFGTLHHLFEVLTLIQTKKIKKRPVILCDHAFWSPLQKYIKEVLIHRVYTVSEEDDELYQVVDSWEAAVKVIEGDANFKGHVVDFKEKKKPVKPAGATPFQTK